MKDYNADKIRNICLLGHGGCGKTTLAEAMLYNTGVLDRFGNVTDGNTTMDYDAEEIKREISINTALAPCEWNGFKINIIDTPGYFDFVGEVVQGIQVADGAVIVASAKDGVEVGTEKGWEYASNMNIPKLIFINKIDVENADFFKTFSQMTKVFGKSVIAFEIPIMNGQDFVGIVNVATMKAKKFEGNKFIPTEIPEDMKDKIAELREGIIEAVAESDEELMEKYFEGETFTDEEIKNGLKHGIADGEISPVFCGTATGNAGVELLMNAINKYVPAFIENGSVTAYKPGTEEEIEVKTSTDEPFSGLVFKTIVDPFVGKITYFKVYSGEFSGDSVVYNVDKDKTEKISQIFLMNGKNQVNVKKIVTGDIGAVAKLNYTETNDTICDKSHPVSHKKIKFPTPYLKLAVIPKSKGDEDKIGIGLHRLLEEDPTFKMEINKETKQTVISGIGDQHLDVIISKLKSKFKVEVDLVDPKVPYRETIRGKAKVEGKHKKQSGGHGQYGVVVIEFERGEEIGLTFEEKVFGGSVPRNYFPAVEKGLQDSMNKGTLAGYPMVNVKATLLDGKYHPVDSSEMSFKIAAGIAYREGIAKATPVILEPIAHVEVYITDDYMGDIIGDLNKRRGRIMGMNPQGNGLQQVLAEVPLAEMFKYTTDLRSMTHGRGYFKMEFDRYEDAPNNVAEKVIADSKKDSDD